MLGRRQLGHPPSALTRSTFAAQETVNVDLVGHDAESGAPERAGGALGVPEALRVCACAQLHRQLA